MRDVMCLNAMTILDIFDVLGDEHYGTFFNSFREL